MEAYGKPLGPARFHNFSDPDKFLGHRPEIGTRGFLAAAHTFTQADVFSPFGLLRDYTNLSALSIDPTYASPDWNGVKDPWHGFQVSGRSHCSTRGQPPPHPHHHPEAAHATG